MAGRYIKYQIFYQKTETPPASQPPISKADWVQRCSLTRLLVLTSNKTRESCNFREGTHGLRYQAETSSDDPPVWTDFCLCQPVSAAGAGGGFDS